MSRSCPALTTDLVPPQSVPLSPTAPWQPAPEPPPRVNSTHFFMYVPKLLTDRDQRNLRAVLHSNQFPKDRAACERVLLLYDDALTAGLGYSARLIALALLVAVQEKRVLINVAHPTARWCGRPPYTLGCYYEPHTHCPIPHMGNNSNKWSTRGSSFGLEERRLRSMPMLRISTSQVHKATFWYKFHPQQALYAATHELLFWPRTWVRSAARCIMRAANLEDGNYAVVHARFSVEKKQERGAKLPKLADYLPATEAFLARANVSRLFLQTSTPDAVDLFEGWAKERNWDLSYTQNVRSTRDPWMASLGKKGSNYSAAGERTSVVAQTINAIIAGRAHHFLSPTSSMWTQFIRSLMGRRISDRLTDGSKSGGELYEECLLAKASNASQTDMKRCTRNVPFLMTLHRVSFAGKVQDAV